MRISEVLVRRKNKLNLKSGSGAEKDTQVLLYSMLKNIEALGYSLSADVMRLLLEYSEEELKELYFELLPVLKWLKGADVEYKPMYKGFPEEVAQKNEVELFFNAIVHYVTDGHWMPASEKKERLPLYETTAETELGLGTEEDIREIAKNLLGSKTSLSEQDKDDLKAIIAEQGIENCLPDQIPMKEILALFSQFLLKEFWNRTPDELAVLLQPYFQTATDVLRLIAALSDSDISLAESPRICRLSRRERRMIMDLLAGIRNPLEDMFRYREEWIRAGERIHPGEYQNEKYAAIRECFRKIRNNERPLFFGGQVEQLLLSGDTLAAAKLLMSRPGEFVRRLDVLLRRTKEEEKQEEILDLFEQVGDKVSVPVLLQAMTHFDYRDDNEIRVFFPKGMLAKAMGIRNDLKSLNPLSMLRVRTAGVCRDLLRKQFRERPPMGKVFISEDIKNYPVPFSQRSASSGAKLLLRGSQVPIDGDIRTIRAFVHWTNLDDSKDDSSRMDIDLSAAFYDRDWQYVTHISYTQLRDGRIEAYHSGDIVNGGPASGEGVAEFLDVDIDKVAEVAPYVVFQVYNYTEQSFKTMPNVRFGWMYREKPESGEIFEPRTVKNLFHLSADSTVVIPAILDCLKRKLIWCDIIKPGRNEYFGNNLESNFHGVTAIGYAMTHLRKPMLDDLIRLNAQARGEITNDRDEADIIFDTNTDLPVRIFENQREDGTVFEDIEERKDVPIITPFDLDYFMGQML
ncbi:MAG: TerD family protein [Firmicutes bacterium]|nr:TerD family protein [Bacillota bacterium]